MNNTDAHLEAILFLKGDPMSIKEIADVLGITEEEVKDATENLINKLEGRGIKLLKKDNSVVLATSPESSSFTKKMAEEEFNSELSKSSLEVLSIVVYKGNVSRTEIDYIRGVNSSFTLRNLMIRGLIERMANSQDKRVFLYKPSFEFLRFLGIKNIEEMPEYGDLKNKTENFIKENEQNEDNNNSDI